ncbi:MAG TPA: glycosyltransferase family 8 protein [Fimbriiglobus sp.]|jgi:lipopolysaccharide biosynthesis glycosyltransferase
MPGKSDVYLLCAANSAYAMPLAVMLTSVVANLRSGRPLHIHLLVTEFDSDLKEKVERSVMRNVRPGGTVTFTWHIFDADRFASYFHKAEVRHLSADSYSRMVCDEYLPADCGKVVYLDCDLVVCRDISDLSDALNEDKVLGAISNIWIPYVSTMWNGRPVVFNYAELGIPPQSRYFQCGVLVLNMPLWRARGVPAKLLDYLSLHHTEVIFHDQGVFNAVLHDQWQRLDQRWNQVATVLYPKLWKAPAYTRAEWKRAFADPYVVHFDGPNKPWKPDFTAPRGSFFFKYLDKTEFAGTVSPPWAVRLEQVIGFRTFYHISRARNFAIKIARRLFRRG